MNIWIMVGAVTAVIIAGIIIALVVKLINRNREAERLNRRIMSLEGVNASLDETSTCDRIYSFREKMDLEEELAKALRSINSYKGACTKYRKKLADKEWPAAEPELTHKERKIGELGRTQFIQAIKQHRIEYGSGLKDAKEEVERILASMGYDRNGNVIKGE